MVTKTNFIDHFIIQCSANNQSGSALTSTTFLRTIMPRQELAQFIVPMSKWAKLPVTYREAQTFLDTANYNVADLYDFLIGRMEERKQNGKYRLAKVLMGASVVVVIYSLFEVNFPLCFISMGVGSGAYQYLFPGR